MRELFRPGNSPVASASQAAPQPQTARLRQSLRYQTQQHFGNWSSRSRKRRTTGRLVPARDILHDLATKINHQKKCKFNINRSTILDGAIRGFKQVTYDPCHAISVRFSDDMGVPEEAVGLGGPRREFLRLLMEALPQSTMFEGEEGKMNLALDSTDQEETKAGDNTHLCHWSQYCSSRFLSTTFS